jgi:hypothetical protein
MLKEFINKRRGNVNIFKVYVVDCMGYEGDTEIFATNYSRALEEFNNLVRETIKEAYEIVDKSEFSHLVSELREDKYKLIEEIICRKCPFILYKDKDGKLKANIYEWDEPSREYMEQDIICETVVLEKIELLE